MQTIVSYFPVSWFLEFQPLSGYKDIKNFTAQTMSGYFHFPFMQ